MAREAREFRLRLFCRSPAVLFALEFLDARRLVQGDHGVDVAFRPVQKIQRLAVANFDRKSLGHTAAQGAKIGSERPGAEPRPGLSFEIGDKLRVHCPFGFEHFAPAFFFLLRALFALALRAVGFDLKSVLQEVEKDFPELVLDAPCAVVVPRLPPRPATGFQTYEPQRAGGLEGLSRRVIAVFAPLACEFLRRRLSRLAFPAFFNSEGNGFTLDEQMSVIGTSRRIRFGVRFRLGGVVSVQPSAVAARKKVSARRRARSRVACETWISRVGPVRSPRQNSKGSGYFRFRAVRFTEGAAARRSVAGAISRLAMRARRAERISSPLSSGTPCGGGISIEGSAASESSSRRGRGGRRGVCPAATRAR